jgi:choline dehydrogenase-like flavoprotein
VRRDRREAWLPDHRAWYEACLALGFADSPDQNDPDSTGVGPFPFNNVDGVRWSTAIAYLNPARDRPNLTIMPDSLAHRVLFDGRRGIGVQAHAQGEPFTEMADEVILAAGAIGSPHLLLLSGVGSTAHLAAMGIPLVHRLPGVGENLRDHPQLPLVFKTRPAFDLGGATHPLQVALRYTAAGSSLRNDMLIHPFSDASRGVYYTEQTAVGVGMVACIYLAESAGRLRLRSPDPRVQPFLDYNFLDTEFDRVRMRESVRICLDLAEQGALKEIIESCLDPVESDLASDDSQDDWMLRNVRTSHHISGTCKMGPASDPMAVVDQLGRVHGLAGLRVADASIMPDCIRANTNVTAMVIGERIADFVKQGE